VAVNVVKFGGRRGVGIAYERSRRDATLLANEFRPASQGLIGTAVVLDYRIALAMRAFPVSMLSATPQSLGLPPTPAVNIVQACVAAA
jgi:hypothetical protein